MPDGRERATSSAVTRDLNARSVSAAANPPPTLAKDEEQHVPAGRVVPVVPQWQNFRNGKRAKTLGVIDDMWFRWVTDFRLPGADRGQGGIYLLVPDGYDGPLPEGGFNVRRARTNHVMLLGRVFIDRNEGNDPGPSAARVKEQLKIYSYVPGAAGFSIGSYLTGKKPLAPLTTPAAPRFVEGTGLEINTIPPNDFGHYELLDKLVQLEPAEALDAELAGQFAAIGIVKGETFDPDDRLRTSLDEAVAVGNAMSRMLGMGAHPSDDFRLYDGGSAWWNMLFAGGFEFTNPPPLG